MASSTDAQIRSEIARLTATINQHKSLTSAATRTNFRSNKYINPNYKPPSTTTVGPSYNAVQASTSQVKPSQSLSTDVKDVILNGVAFESSGRSLVRKDLPKPVSSGPKIPRTNPQDQSSFVRKSGHLVHSSRQYKPKRTNPQRRRPANRNMTLTNSVRPFQSRPKRTKFSDKPCPRFTTTGACSRGLTCSYQHDPSKIAVCWNFLQGNCPNTAETCNLSHDPTPERTPLCLHFLNKGRCTRNDCPFPHVNVGARKGVCRDFAVLGYCTRGLDCDKQHVRECPDFAEKGTCGTKGCKLPHVIRANRNRPPPAKPAIAATMTTSSEPSADGNSSVSTADMSEQQHAVHVSATDAQLGDEYISLTFNESDSESADDDENESDDADDDDDEGEDEEDEEESDTIDGNAQS